MYIYCSINKNYSITQLAEVMETHEEYNTYLNVLPNPTRIVYGAGPKTRYPSPTISRLTLRCHFAAPPTELTIPLPAD